LTFLTFLTVGCLPPAPAIPIQGPALHLPGGF
jgi:hypothetical protein